MLQIYLNKPIDSQYVSQIEKEFEGYCEESWFTHPDIIHAVESIDNVKYLGKMRFESDVIGIFGVDDLSGTSKTVVSSCIHPTLLHPCDWLGQSASKHLLQLSKNFNMLYTLGNCYLKFEPEQELYVMDWESKVLGKDLYDEILKRGDWNVIIKGLQLQISKDYI